MTVVPVTSASWSSRAAALVRSMRPQQWIKNLLVFAAPAAAGLLTNWHEILHALAAFVSFCAASSATYLINDLADVDADRLHPTKRYRPIAAGLVSVTLARITAIALIIAAFGFMALTTQRLALGYVAIYLVITLAYSAGLKRVPVIDLIIVASGFVLRALAGASAVNVEVSDWFLIVITFGSLFVVVGKRFAELREVGDDAGTRATLDHYTEPYLRMVVTASLGGTAVSYCLFALERASLAGEGFPAFQLSIVPVIAALLRYLLVLEQGRGGAPEDVFLSDRWLQLLGVCWLMLFALGVYFT